MEYSNKDINKLVLFFRPNSKGLYVVTEDLTNPLKKLDIFYKKISGNSSNTFLLFTMRNFFREYLKDKHTQTAWCTVQPSNWKGSPYNWDTEAKTDACINDIVYAAYVTICEELNVRPRFIFNGTNYYSMVMQLTKVFSKTAIFNSIRPAPPKDIDHNYLYFKPIKFKQYVSKNWPKYIPIFIKQYNFLFNWTDYDTLTMLLRYDDTKYNKYIKYVPLKYIYATMVFFDWQNYSEDFYITRGALFKNENAQAIDKMHYGKHIRYSDGILPIRYIAYRRLVELISFKENNDLSDDDKESINSCIYGVQQFLFDNKTFNIKSKNKDELITALKYAPEEKFMSNRGIPVITKNDIHDALVKYQ